MKQTISIQGQLRKINSSKLIEYVISMIVIEAIIKEGMIVIQLVFTRVQLYEQTGF